INDTFKQTLRFFKKQYVVLTLATITAILCMIFIVTIPPLIFGIYFMCIQLMKGKKIKVSDLFHGFSYFFRSWGLFILAFLAILLGLILLVIPGLLLIVLFQYAVAVSLLEDKGPIDSLKRSFAIGKENFAFSVMLFVLTAVISSIGGLTRVGILITIPFTALWVCVSSFRLAKKTKAA
ncbi:hypothetical protein KY358_05480, partial [Candidatus Woesearchaeota archaeon]|nr:hypothetical protein [Candidatus Woesearchaeota archaeon]